MGRAKQGSLAGQNPTAKNSIVMALQSTANNDDIYAREDCHEFLRIRHWLFESRCLLMQSRHRGRTRPVTAR
jgi:hypothetical protein